MSNVIIVSAVLCLSGCSLAQLQEAERHLTELRANQEELTEELTDLKIGHRSPEIEKRIDHITEVFEEQSKAIDDAAEIRDIAYKKTIRQEGMLSWVWNLVLVATGVAGGVGGLTARQKFKKQAPG